MNQSLIAVNSLTKQNKTKQKQQTTTLCIYSTLCILKNFSTVVQPISRLVLFLHCMYKTQHISAFLQWNFTVLNTCEHILLLLLLFPYNDLACHSTLSI